MAKIFISYRREDAGFAVDQVHGALKPYAASADDIFVDVDNIPPGVDFVEHLNKYVDQCDVMLVAIGVNWMRAVNAAGQRRLEDPDDFVRIEIESALKRGIPVVPLLLGGAEMPPVDQLPESLKPIVRRQAVAVPRGQVQPAIDRMMRGLGFAEVQKTGGGLPGWLVPFAAVIILAAGAFGLWNSGVLDQFFETSDGPVEMAEIEPEPPKSSELPPETVADLEDILGTGDPSFDTGSPTPLEQGKDPAVLEPFESEADAARRKALIKRLQAALKDLGYYSGGTDGVIGPGTARAAAQFKQASGADMPRLETGSLDRVEGFVHAAESAVVEKQAELKRLDDARRAALAERGLAAPPSTRTYSPGSTFRDSLSGGGRGPEMVVVPSGSFRMGSNDGDSDERPVHSVAIAKPFAVGKYEVTWAEWEVCVSDGGCDGSGPNSRGGDEGWGKGSRPVINVDWNDAKAYVRWLSRKTGENYRLLSEAEWEYVARAGTSTAYWWGNRASHDYANYGADACCSGLASGRDRWENTAPAGSFSANAFGLHDLHGNVYEWTEDCWNSSYSGAPSNGSAWLSGECERRVLRGGSWSIDPNSLRSAIRGWGTASNRNYSIGFRIARDLSE